MSIFDIFKPEWKKQFEELVANHKDALEAYIQGKYEVFQDMRVDDRLLFEDYQKTYSSSNYAHDIESLTDQDKKHLISVKDNIVRLYRSYSKYDTKTKRVASLINRFSYNDVFNTIFGHSHFLGENWTLNTLDEDQLDFILNNYNRLVSLATGKKKEQEKRQAKQKEKLLEKVYTKRVNKYISDQAKAEAVLSMPVLNPTIVNIIKDKVTVLKQEYKSYNLYNLVRQVLLLGLDAYSPIAQDIYVLSRENVFKEASKLFDKYKNNYRVRTKLLEYLRTTTNKELCIKGLILGHNINIVNNYTQANNLANKEPSSLESSAKDTTLHKEGETDKSIKNTPQEKITIKKAPVSISATFVQKVPKQKKNTDKTVAYAPDIDVYQWIDDQEVFNEIIMKRRNLLDEFIFVTTFTPIAGKIGKKSVKKHLDYIQITGSLYSSSLEEGEEELYMNYNEAMNCMNGQSVLEDTYPNILTKLFEFINSLNKALPSKSLYVIFGTNGLTNSEPINSKQMGKLKRNLNSFGIQNLELKNIYTLEETPRFILLIELVSSIKDCRNTRKEIIKEFPGASICYVSIYKEISQSGYELS